MAIIMGKGCIEVIYGLMGWKGLLGLTSRLNPLRLGGLASICVFCNYSGTTVARILYCTSYERFYFSLSNDIVIRKCRQQILKMEI